MSRSSFVNMLSQKLKEQRNIGDFAGGMAAKFESKASPEITMDLLPNKEFSEDLRPNAGSDFFPRREAAQSAPLTIFFAGKMLVFNDFPAEKAKEIMELARSGISAGTVSDSESSAEKLNLKRNRSESHIPDLNIASASESSQRGFDQNQLPLANRNSLLGQKKRSSLHRFFEQRKERVTARAPYQVQSRRESPFSKPDEECRRLPMEGLRDLDLKL